MVTTEERIRDAMAGCVDGNEAAAWIAHRLSEVIAIYPITPASPMGELADAWSAAGRRNVWGVVPEVVEMQSEAGAAGVLHGAVMRGALATTFTASQGLLLMLPNMFKIAGELSPAVMHVAARTVATHALSIFGDHSDVMAVRAAGWAMLCSSSVQQAHDFALIAHAVSLATRVPFVHFFDGFRTSHQLDRIGFLDDADLLALVDQDDVRAQRGRGLSPDRPLLRGSAQNPDVFFQAREASNSFHAAVPGAVQGAMDALAARTGRGYHLVDYEGAPDADRVIVVMGSGAGAVEETVRALDAEGERVGMLTIRLFRPFPSEAVVAALPSTVRAVAVLDRTKEPGAPGEPLFQDVLCALAEHAQQTGSAMPRVIGGRYGLSSKEFTPSMAKAVFDELAAGAPKSRFTVGIVDDVTGLSLRVDGAFSTEAADVRAVFFGLGSDGTVGANKNTVKIVSEETDRYVQGYFVYDSKKSGSLTVSHLRFSSRPITSTYLIERASFVACHSFGLLDRVDVLKVAEPGATVLLNCPFEPDRVWGHLSVEVQRQILEKDLSLWVIDANAVARAAGMGGRINTVMQPCFFALSGVMPPEQALDAIRRSIRRTYGKRGETVVLRNLAAVDGALASLHPVQIPSAADPGGRHRRPAVAATAPDFVQRVTAVMLAGDGDLLPVSALPVDGTFPTGTARWEKRAIGEELPVWDPSICIDCGKCAIVCPHAAIRMKVFDSSDLTGAPSGLQSKPFGAHGDGSALLTIQVAPDDCTGCGICVDVCPARSKQEVRHKALNMKPAEPRRPAEREAFEFFLEIPDPPADRLPMDTVKGSQIRQPLFEFSGACAGCGETPYLKLLTQLFGDRLMVANATGCSSIYGGNLPTTPWTTNGDGRGPAWANSLFEDNGEFGLGMYLALDRQSAHARHLLVQLSDLVGADLVEQLLGADQRSDLDVTVQRDRVAELKRRLSAPELRSVQAARDLEGLADDLVRRSVWIVGGDGWAYDIGSAGLDHVLASGRNVNVLVLDTEVYSNTGGQASKSTPRGALAKFAARGKPTAKKDLGMMAMAYGNVYVAQIALGGNDMQTVRALQEAEAWDGPSLVIAYSTCIAHGIDMATSMTHQKDAVRSGYWPLFRFNPGAGEHEHPFRLDSKAPSISLEEFSAAEGRFALLARSDPTGHGHLMESAEGDVRERRRFHEQLAGIERTTPALPNAEDAEATPISRMEWSSP